MTSRKPSRSFVVVAAVSVLTLLAAACSNADSSGKDTAPTNAPGVTVTTFKGTDFTKNIPVKAPGVSGTEIHVASVTSKTSPLGGQEAELNNGIKAYFGFVNAQGGIYGRKLKLTHERDDQLGNNTSEVEGLLAQDNAYAAFIASDLFTGATKLAKAGIPTFGWNINAEWAGPKNFFPNVAPICLDGCPLLPHVVPTLVKDAGAHKVAILGYNVPQAAGCVKGNTDSLAKFGSEAGATLAYSDASLTFGQLDFSAQVGQMKDKGVDFLITCMDFNADYAVAKEMARQGIRNKVAFYHANMYNQEFVRKNAALLEGDIVLAQITAVEQKPTIPAIQEYLDYTSANNVKVSEMTMQGWIAARQLVDALKATGPNFTWANLISAWNQQTSYSAGGWIIPIDWTRQHTAPKEGDQFRSEFECANFLKVKNGGFVPYLAQPGKPWVCWDGHKLDQWQEPVNVAFDGGPFHLADAKTGATG
jgi:branched-chain amino acid transport system substrate-binding protein